MVDFCTAIECSHSAVKNDIDVTTMSYCCAGGDDDGGGGDGGGGEVVVMMMMMSMVVMMMVECATVSKIHPAHHRRVAHSGKEKHVFREGPSK